MQLQFHFQVALNITRNIWEVPSDITLILIWGSVERNSRHCSFFFFFLRNVLKKAAANFTSCRQLPLLIAGHLLTLPVSLFPSSLSTEMGVISSPASAIMHYREHHNHCHHQQPACVHSRRKASP